MRHCNDMRDSEELQMLVFQYDDAEYIENSNVNLRRIM